MMKILAVATARSDMSVALLEGDRIRAEFAVNDERQHSLTLLPAIDHLCKEENIPIGSIDLFACAAGPGSFTGLRVGLATVKGLAMVTGKPVVGVSTLEAMVMNVGRVEMPVCALIPARERWYYMGLYRWVEEGKVVPMQEERCCELEAIRAALPHGAVLIIGEGIEAYRKEIAAEAPGRVTFGDPIVAHVRAGCVGILAYQRFVSGEYHDAATLLPNYIQVSAAERHVNRG